MRTLRPEGVNGYMVFSCTVIVFFLFKGMIPVLLVSMVSCVGVVVGEGCSVRVRALCTASLLC